MTSLTYLNVGIRFFKKYFKCYPCFNSHDVTHSWKRFLSGMNKIKNSKKREISRGDVELTMQNQQLECGGTSETERHQSSSESIQLK
jgi:hypothetical protein